MRYRQRFKKDFSRPDEMRRARKWGGPTLLAAALVAGGTALYLCREFLLPRKYEETVQARRISCEDLIVQERQAYLEQLLEKEKKKKTVPYLDLIHEIKYLHEEEEVEKKLGRRAYASSNPLAFVNSGEPNVVYATRRFFEFPNEEDQRSIILGNEYIHILMLNKKSFSFKFNLEEGDGEVIKRVQRAIFMEGSMEEKFLYLEFGSSLHQIAVIFNGTYDVSPRCEEAASHVYTKIKDKLAGELRRSGVVNNQDLERYLETMSLENLAPRFRNARKRQVLFFKDAEVATSK